MDGQSVSKRFQMDGTYLHNCTFYRVHNIYAALKTLN